MIRHSAILLPLLLIGCQTPATVPIDQNIEEITQTGNNILEQQNQEPVLHDSEAPIITQSGVNFNLQENVSDTGLLKLGDENAPLTLIVFTEYHSKYCREFQTEQLPILISNYVITGKMQIHIGIFTLEKYPNGINAAKSGYCAAVQEKGLTMHKLLFEKNNKDLISFTEYAKEIELDEEKFDECMKSEETEKILKNQKQWAQNMGVQYVPTFFLNGEKLIGLQYLANLQGKIDFLLQKK